MAYKDLREFIAALEKDGQLLKVTEEVNWKYELGGWARKSIDLGDAGPALLFENLKDYPQGYRVFTQGISTYRRFALAMGLSPDTPVQEIIKVYKQRLQKPIDPVLVKDGPVKENIHTGDDINLFEFPIPWWTPKDGNRFLGTWHGIVTKDLNTGIQNVGLYRVQVHDEKHTGAGFLPYQHMGHHYAQRERINKPLEVAIVIGADETVVMSAATPVKPGVDEFRVASGLRGQAIELVKCATVDLNVPANAELVVEGLLLPHERKQEGPFGEHPGYHGGSVRMRPILKVTGIMHRNNPIFVGSLLGKPVCENHIVDNIVNSAEGLRMFEEEGPEGVVAINCPPEGDSVLGTVIAIKAHYVGQSRSVGRIWISKGVGKHTKCTVIVDDDIDPFDLGQVWWAITTRTQGTRDIEVLRFGTTSRSDPSVPREHGEYTDKVIIDATKKLDYPYNPHWGGHWAPVCVPPKEAMNLADLKWRRMQGEKGLDQEIALATQDMEGRAAQKWAAWRDKAYQMTPEEREREIALSYPIHASEEEE